MNVKIETIEGEDCRLYSLLGPLVMNPKVLEYNNNYPFRTSSAYTWFVALREEEVCGFVPVKRSKEQLLIDNYYECDDEVLEKLVVHILSVCTGDLRISAVIHQKHKELFLGLGFGVKIEWKKYYKMERQALKSSKEKADGQT